MSIALRSRERSHPPKLRLVPSRRDPSAAHMAARTTPPSEPPPGLRLVLDPSPEASHVLVVGRDAAQRAAVVDELTNMMGPSTIFEEAAAFGQVLVRAPASRMVVLSGDLEDVPAELLMQKLAHRHPGLAVVSLSVPALATA